MLLFATSVYLRGLNLRIRLASQCKSLPKFNLRLLASLFGQGITQYSGTPVNPVTNEPQKSGRIQNGVVVLKGFFK